MKRLWLVSLLVLAACHRTRAPAEDPNTVLSVNGETLSVDAFNQELSRETESTDQAPPTSEQLEPVKRALAQTLIERMLLVQDARERMVAVSPEEVDRSVLRIRADYPTDQFDDALSQGHLSLAELKKKTATLLTIEKLFEQVVYARVALTEEEIRQYYDAHTDEFQEPEQVHAAQIVVKELDEAKRIQQLLRQGQKLPDLARKYSLSADAKVGGDLGWFPRGVMPKVFDDTCFKLGVGQTSDVVASEYGFHLFKVLDKRAAVRKDFSQVRAEVEKKLIGAKRLQAQADYVQALRAKAQIHINEAALQAAMGLPAAEAAAH
jgi:peptidyl-prolyl cis-trans isomerase C